jgi:hypothetical protein
MQSNIPEPAPGVFASFTEADGFKVIGNFLQAYCAPYSLIVIRAIGNTAPGVNSRVPEPIEGDFIVMSSMSQPRLATNLSEYVDNIFVGSILGDLLTVTALTRGSIEVGSLLFDGNWPQKIAAGTTIKKQLNGTPNGAGAYEVSVSQTLAAENLYAGIRTDIAAAEWIVQLDVHGPNSMNNSRLIDTLFRSEVAVDFFFTQNPQIVPLYSDDPRQSPFQNEEQQIEFRWTIDLHMQINVTISTPQQFADQIKIKTIAVDKIQ